MNMTSVCCLVSELVAKPMYVWIRGPLGSRIDFLLRDDTLTSDRTVNHTLVQ